jgi:glycogen debranching enzyme
MESSSDFTQKAQSILRLNDMGAFTKPAPRQYPHQWNWDAAVIALGLSHFDLPRALDEIRSLLKGQWKDGMVPHIIYHTGRSDYFPDPDFWQTDGSANAPQVATSGITQPPLAASVLRAIHARTPVLEFIREVYPALLRWHRWFHTQRDADGSRLACLIHPWESGTDDSPRWLNAISRITPHDLPAYQRLDTVHVTGAQRPHKEDYDRFIHLVNVFRTNHYDPAALLAHSPFLVQDILTNSILHRADLDLRDLALAIGQPVDEIDGWVNSVRQVFNERFWDAERGLYFDYDLRAGSLLRVNTQMTFLPLYAGLADAAQAERLVNEHLLNPAEYAPGDGVGFWVTSASRTEPGWEARRYWRGPIWIITNWLIARGLKRYGYTELAESLRRDSIRLIRDSGFWEYFDASDGSGCGSPDFSWSAALAIELLAGEG